MSLTKCLTKQAGNKMVKGWIGGVVVEILTGQLVYILSSTN